MAREDSIRHTRSNNRPRSDSAEDLKAIFESRILSFAVDKKTSLWIEPYSCDCQDIRIQTEKQEILLESVHNGETDFIRIRYPSALKKNDFTWRIFPDENAPIVFDKAKYQDDGTLEALRFRFGTSCLFVFAIEGELILTKGTDDAYEFEPWVNENDILFNFTNDPTE